MRNNQKGFTLIEILASVTILGILMSIAIVSISGVMDNAKNEYYISSVKEMKLAGQFYFQDNRNRLPKAIGRASTVTLETLYNAKYIDEIVDYNKKPCKKDESYVKVFRFDKNDYSYTANLVCEDGDGNIPEPPKPIVSVKLTNDSSNVKGTVAKLEISPLDYNDDKIKKTYPGYAEATIMSYSYIIYKDGKEVYSSGNINAKYAKNISKEIDISKYTPGSLRVKLTATNSYGGKDSANGKLKYNDAIPPTCGTVTGEAKPDGTGKIDDWYTTDNASRTITVQCIDNPGGSGCARAEFTQKFRKDAKTKEITIKDNAGNTNKCTVNVYIDRVKPTLTIKAYKGKKNSAGNIVKTNNNVITTVTADNSNDTVTLILPDGSTHNKWLNNSSYPDGVYYEATLNDAISLGDPNTDPGAFNSIWQWNQAGLKQNASNVSALSSDRQSLKALNGKNGSSSFSLSAEGYRKGTYTLKDEAKHTVTVNIVAPIDRTAPTVPTTSLYKWNGSTRPTSSSGLSGYSNNSWFSGRVFTRPSGSTDAVSGLERYEVTTTGTTSNVTNSTVSYRNVEAEGVSKVKYRSCDIAGNCSANNGEKTIKLDRTVPTCSVTIGGTAHSNSYRWENTTLSLSKSDPNASNNSAGSGLANHGLSTSSSVTYNSSTSGTQSTNTNGTTWYCYVSDNAGNTGSNSNTVKVDKNDPSISIAVSSKSTSYNTQGIKYAITSNDVGSGTDHYCVTTGNSCTPNSTTSTTSNNHGIGFTAYDGSTKTVKACVSDKSGRTKCSSGVSYKVYKDCTDQVNDGGASCGGYGGCSCPAGVQYATKTQPRKDSHSGNACTSIKTTNGCSRSCDCVPKGVPNTCNNRGDTKMAFNFSWNCNSHTGHTEGYWHYCADANGNLSVDYSGGKLICPDQPYGPDQGWNIIHDSSIAYGFRLSIYGY